MKDENKYTKEREKILSDQYGRFDIIDSLISKEDLLIKKPRWLFEQLVEILRLEKTDINVYSFRAWLRRYRKQTKINNKTVMSRYQNSFSSSIKTASQDDIDSGFLASFIPSNPSDAKEATNPLIKEIKL